MLPKKHPVLRQRSFVIPSAPLREFEAAFFACLEEGELSMCLHGTPRVGKTSSLQYLSYSLQKTKRAAFRRATFEQQQAATRIDRDDFWRKFLGEGADSLPSWRNPAAARLAVVNGLMVDSETMGTDCVMLMIDEAQNLVIHHFSMLKVLMDELIDLGRSPFFLLSSQPEIQQRPDELIRKNCHDLVDRFFTRWHRMRGLHPHEIKEFISAYDELRWSPEEGAGGSPPTFTEFFAPDLTKSGGLGTLSTYFSEAFKDLNREVGRQPDDELETKYLVSAIRVFLIEVNANPRLLSSKELALTVRHAVRRCGIYENRRRVGDAEQLFKKQSKK